MTTDSDFAADELSIRCSDAVQLISEYLDDELNSHDLYAFDTHLAHCQGCTVLVDQINMTITLSRAANRAEVSLMPKNFDVLVAMLQEQAAARDDTR
jgi:predicted anti-sigma-YlaC factor YlaD